MTIPFGVTAADKVSGFSGVVTGFCSYITGCNQYLVSPRVDKEGKHVDARWFDEQRLVVDHSVQRVEVDNSENTGPDLPAPIR